MAEAPSIVTGRSQLTELRDNAMAFFTAVEAQGQTSQPVQPEDTDEIQWGAEAVQEVPPALSEELTATSEDLARRIRILMVGISGMARGAALLGEADLRDFGHYTKSMAAAVRFRRYRYQDLYVHHDEDIVLGVTPASQSEHERVSAEQARRIFSDAYRRVLDLTDLISTRETARATGAEAELSRYTPDTAFIMMQIDKSQPELNDVLDTVEDVFKHFGIKARRADEIEHDDVITGRILEEIASCEFLFADLSGERPSVYYEVGYAHALKKRVILYRKKATRIHFDLAHRNCPEYESLRELRQLLTKRLTAMTGKQVPETE